MTAETTHFKLGLFVLTGLALIAVALFVFGSGVLSRQPTLTVESYFTGSISGIAPGSMVQYLGVQVGKVEQVTLTADVYEQDKPFQGRRPYALVRFAVGTKFFGDLDPGDLRNLLSDWIAQGLRVKSQPQGLTGESYLEMGFVERPDAHPPLNKDWNPENLYMPSVESLTGNLSNTLEALQRTVNQIAAADIGGILKNIDDLVLQVTRTNHDLRQLLEDPRIDGTLADVSSSAADLRVVLDDSGRNITDAVSQLDSTLAALHKTSRNLPQTTADLRAVLEQVSELLARQNETIVETLRNIERTSGNLRVLSEEVRDYPSGALFGQPPPEIKP
jgi:ABC-type transporter Mla subunit MlaD